MAVWNFDEFEADPVDAGTRPQRVIHLAGAATSGGPVLAVGPRGLWIKTRPTRGQAMWLPWEAIARIYRRRWSLEKMVCVQPPDPRVGSGLGSYTAVDSAANRCLPAAFPFPADDNLVTRPNYDGPVRTIPGGAAVTTARAWLATREP